MALLGIGGLSCWLKHWRNLLHTICDSVAFCQHPENVVAFLLPTGRRPSWVVACRNILWIETRIGVHKIIAAER